jgi:hypothetical protein
MLTPNVVKMYPGAQSAARAPAAGARAETGPDGPRAALIRPSAEQTERLGAPADRNRPGQVAAAYRATALRQPDGTGRAPADRRFEGVIETMARLEALEAGVRDAPLLVVAEAETEAAVRLNGAPLRPLPLRSNAARETLAAFARRFLGAEQAAAPTVFFGVGGGGDVIALDGGAVAVARIGPALAETPDGVTLGRPGPGALAIRFPNGLRLTATGLDAARAMTLVFSDGRALSLSSASLAADRDALDLRI